MQGPAGSQQMPGRRLDSGGQATRSPVPGFALGKPSNLQPQLCVPAPCAPWPPAAPLCAPRRARSAPQCASAAPPRSSPPAAHDPVVHRSMWVEWMQLGFQVPQSRAVSDAPTQQQPPAAPLGGAAPAPPAAAPSPRPCAASSAPPLCNRVSQCSGSFDSGSQCQAGSKAGHRRRQRLKAAAGGDQQQWLTAAASSASCAASWTGSPSDRPHRRQRARLGRPQPEEADGSGDG